MDRGDKERKKPRVSLDIFPLMTENCTQSRKRALRGELNGGRQRGESWKLWKEGKGLTGYHLWKKPTILTIHMCTDESPAKETQWMNAPTASRRLCSVFTASSYTSMFTLSDPASLVPSVPVHVWKRVLSLNVFEKWHKWDFASTPCGRPEPGGVTPAASLLFRHQGKREKHAHCRKFNNSLLERLRLLCWLLFFRPSERSGEDVDIIMTRLREVKAFHRFPPPLLLQICACAFYECLEKGITCTYRRITVVDLCPAAAAPRQPGTVYWRALNVWFILCDVWIYNTQYCCLYRQCFDRETLAPAGTQSCPALWMLKCRKLQITRYNLSGISGVWMNNLLFLHSWQ